MTKASEDFAADKHLEAAVMARRAARSRTAPRYQWPLSLVLSGLVAALIWVASDHFRRGSVLFSAVVVLALLMRIVLSERDLGWLAIRSRRIDLLCMSLLGVSLTVFSFIVPPPS